MAHSTSNIVRRRRHLSGTVDFLSTKKWRFWEKIPGGVPKWVWATGLDRGRLSEIIFLGRWISVGETDSGRAGRDHFTGQYLGTRSPVPGIRCPIRSSVRRHPGWVGPGHFVSGHYFYSCCQRWWRLLRSPGFLVRLCGVVLCSFCKKSFLVGCYRGLFAILKQALRYAFFQSF